MLIDLFLAVAVIVLIHDAASLVVPIRYTPKHGRRRSM